MRPNSLPWRIHRQSCLQRGAAPAQPLVQRILEQLRHVVHWGNPLSLGVAIVCECQGERMDRNARCAACALHSVAHSAARHATAQKAACHRHSSQQRQPSAPDRP